MCARWRGATGWSEILVLMSDEAIHHKPTRVHYGLGGHQRALYIGTSGDPCCVHHTRYRSLTRHVDFLSADQQFLSEIGRFS